MAVTFVAEAHASNNSTAAHTLSVNKPTGTVDGDVMLAFTGSDIGLGFAPPAGWTQIGSTATAGTDVDCKAWYKVASGEGTSYSVGWWLLGSGSGAQPVRLGGRGGRVGVAVWTGVRRVRYARSSTDSRTGSFASIGICAHTRACLRSSSRGRSSVNGCQRAIVGAFCCAGLRVRELDGGSVRPVRLRSPGRESDAHA